MGLATLAQKFNRAEAFAHVKGRKDKREAMAFVVSVAGRPAPIFGEFDVSEAESEVVDDLVAKLTAQMSGSDSKLVLAALARYGAGILTSETDDDKRKAV